MYLASLSVENFRIFDDEVKKLYLELQPGLNLIVGENNSGKSAIIDALRLILGTQDREWARITHQDFHIKSGTTAKQFTIRCTFKKLDINEAAFFLEWLEPVTLGDTTEYQLNVRLTATRREDYELRERFDRAISVEVKAGPDKEGKAFDGQARESLRATYLKPLRDAEQELAAKRGSRLSQILFAHPTMESQDNLDDTASLAGIMAELNKTISEHVSVVDSVDHLNQKYLQNLTLADDSLAARIQVAPTYLRGVLERLSLSLVDGELEDIRHGLGLDNLLFIATEFLLLQGPNAPLRLALIEEPEAHLHPQLQLRLVEFLESQLIDSSTPVQVLLTSHSPHLASAVNLEHLVVIRRAEVFPMSREHTMLDASDYVHLRHFLDVTRSNLFFARGVLVVEGPAEQLLLPVIAELIGRPLAKYGVSVVNVGGVGLSRYARIFQRQQGGVMNVKVACVLDRDLPPAIARNPSDGEGTLLGTKQKSEDQLSAAEIVEHVRKKVQKCAGGSVRAFVSPSWTLEYDLAMHGFDLLLFTACLLAQEQRPLTDDEYEQLSLKATEDYESMRKTIEDDLGEPIAQEDLACIVYRQLVKGLSKPGVAFQLGWLLRNRAKNDTGFSKTLEQLLPRYLVNAIRYVTGGNDFEEA
jgi:putative ATP-dependent endonuclease of the OLD family